MMNSEDLLKGGGDDLGHLGGERDVDDGMEVRASIGIRWRGGSEPADLEQTLLLVASEFVRSTQVLIARDLSADLVAVD
ncbi:hypothetical protein AYO52_09560 [Dietzia sp. 111N12-1]|nr:hypothetical protein AYO52_09560 [Dietzia sp. 111N12-1]